MGRIALKQKKSIYPIIALVICSQVMIFISAAHPSEGVTQSNGRIRGVITNQDGEPLSLVRIIAIGEKTEDGRAIGLTYTHLLLGGKGSYEMEVPPGRYILIRAAKLPFYIGAKAGPIVVEAGETKTLDLSLTLITSLFF